MKEILIIFALSSVISAELLIATPGLAQQLQLQQQQQIAQQPQQEMIAPPSQQEQLHQKLQQLLQLQQQTAAQLQQHTNDHLNQHGAESINYPSFMLPGNRRPQQNNHNHQPQQHNPRHRPNQPQQQQQQRPQQHQQPSNGNYKATNPGSGLQPGADGALTITIKLQPQQLQGLLTQSQKPIRIQGFGNNQQSLLGSLSQQVVNVVQQAGPVLDEEDSGIIGFWKELKGLMKSMDFRPKAKKQEQTSTYRSKLQPLSSNIQSTIAQAHQSAATEHTNAHINNPYANAPTIGINPVQQYKPSVQLPQAISYSQLAQTQTDTEKEEDGTSVLSNVASTLAKSMTNIPSNIDLMFNDMGRFYRQHLFKLRDSMPDIRGNFLLGNRRDKNPLQGNEGFLDAYGA